MQIPMLMQRSKLHPAWVSALWLAITTLPLQGAELGPVRDAMRSEVLVLGKVSNNPRKHYRYLAPMLDYVVERMGDLGIRKGRVLMARDNRQMLKYLKQGRIDWVTETLFSSLLYREKAGAELLLRKWKKESGEYYSQFVTRKDSDIRKLKDLEGKVIGLEDPGSTTAFFMPLQAMLDADLKVERLDNVREKPLPGAVSYVFGHQELNLSTWLEKGLVQAIAYSNLDWDKVDHTPPAFRENFRIFHRTESVPRALEVVRADLDPFVKARLKQLLLEAENDPEAASVLRNYQSTSRFDELTPELMRRIDGARSTLERVQRQTR